MKTFNKVMVLLLAMFVSSAFVVAEEIKTTDAMADTKTTEKKYSPVLELAISPLNDFEIVTDTKLNKHTKGKSKYFASYFSGKGGVSIKTTDVLFLTPYVSGDVLYKLFRVGLEGKAEFSKNLALLFGLGYRGVFHSDVIWSGADAQLGLELKNTDAFIDFALHNITYFYMNSTTKKADNESHRPYEIHNELELDFVWNFLNPSFNGGLYTNLLFKTEFNPYLEYVGSAYKKTVLNTRINLNGDIGFTMKPVQFFAAKIGVSVSSYIHPQKIKGGKKLPLSLWVKIGVPLETEFSFAKAFVHCRYEPQIPVYYTNKTDFENKLFHKLNLSFGYKL